MIVDVGVAGDLADAAGLDRVLDLREGGVELLLRERRRVEAESERGQADRVAHLGQVGQPAREGVANRTSSESCGPVTSWSKPSPVMPDCHGAANVLSGSHDRADVDVLEVGDEVGHRLVIDGLQPAERDQALRSSSR